MRIGIDNLMVLWRNLALKSFVLSLAAYELIAPVRAEAQTADMQRIDDARGLILQLIEGPFGALVMTVSGLVSIIAAAMGAYRAAMSCLVVAVGAFILRTFVDIFFPPLA